MHWKVPVPLAVVVAWVLLALLEVLLWRHQFPQANSYALQLVAWATLTRRALWVIFTFIVRDFARAVDLRRPPRARAIALHLALVVAIAVLDAAWYRFARASSGLPQTQLPFANYLASTINGSIFLYAIIVSATYAADWYGRLDRTRLRAARLRSALVNSQLYALTLQLHPHFLFNALNSVSELVHRSPATAAAMLRHLRELLRESLSTAPRGLIALQDELEFLRHYLELQQMRFAGLRLVVDAAPDTLDAAVPHFLLQPLVENAIRHGLTPVGGAGTVVLRTRKLNDDTLQITVSDDGAGLSGTTPRIGLGLQNVSERIEQLFGDAAQFRLRPGDQRGTVAEVVLPITACDNETSDVDTAGAVQESAGQPEKPFHVVRIAVLAGAFLLGLAVLKELFVFGIMREPRATALLWLQVDAFSAVAAVFMALAGATMAQRMVLSERRAAWLAMLIALGIVMPLVSVVLRAATGSVFVPDTFQIFSRRATIWIAQDVVIFVVAAVVSYMGAVYQLWNRTELEAADISADLTEVRRSVLQWRLQPAALIPILDELAVLAGRDPEAADYLTARIGDLLRHMLESGKESSVPLSEEVRYLSTLLEVETKLGIRPSVTIAAPAGVPDHLVPSRALHSGLQKFEADTATRVTSIRVRIDDDHVYAAFVNESKHTELRCA